MLAERRDPLWPDGFAGFQVMRGFLGSTRLNF